MNVNNELISSIKNFNFKGWTSDKIIDKYEQVLACREKQIEDLSIELGNIYQSMSKNGDLLKNYENDNLQLRNRTLKLVFKLKIFFYYYFFKF